MSAETPSQCPSCRGLAVTWGVGSRCSRGRLGPSARRRGECKAAEGPRQGSPVPVGKASMEELLDGGRAHGPSNEVRPSQCSTLIQGL